MFFYLCLKLTRGVYNIMDIRKSKFVTAASLIVLLLLLIVWSVYAYQAQYAQLEEKCNSILENAMFKDLNIRLESGKLPEGTRIAGGGIKENGKEDFTPFQETLIKYNAPISLKQLDSVYQSYLSIENIYARTIINKINLRTGEVLESTDSSFHSLWGTIKTHPSPLRRDSTEAVQAIVVAPYKNVFEQLWLLFAASLVFMFFVGWGITYQIKIITTQNRIAELRENFSNAMVHNMKSPLNAILVGIRILRSGKIDNQAEKKKKHFDIVEDECLHLLSLSNKILTIAKIENNKLTLDCAQVPLKPVIEDLIEKYTLRANKSVIFETQYQVDSVYADRAHLCETIGNLIDNAVKYSGTSVHIGILCYMEKGRTKIKVSDNGYGIALKEQVLIFEKFERVSAANKRSLRGGATGFGLGLNYVQKVMQAHGGSVEVESVEEQGSEFTLVFPLLTEEIEPVYTLEET